MNPPNQYHPYQLSYYQLMEIYQSNKKADEDSQKLREGIAKHLIAPMGLKINFTSSRPSQTPENK